MYLANLRLDEERSRVVDVRVERGRKHLDDLFQECHAHNLSSNQFSKRSKLSFLRPLVYTAGGWIPASFGTNQGSWNRRFDPTLRASTSGWSADASILKICSRSATPITCCPTRVKSSFSKPLVYTASRRIPANFGTHQGSWNRRLDPTQRRQGRARTQTS